MFFACFYIFCAVVGGSMEEAIGLSEVCSTIWCNLLCFCCFLFHLQVTKQVKGLQESVSDLNTTLQSSSQGSQTTALNQKRCLCPDFSRRYLCPDFSRQSCFRMWMFWKWRCKQRRRTAKRSRRQGSRNFKLHCNTCKYVKYHELFHLARLPAWRKQCKNWKAKLQDKSQTWKSIKVMFLVDSFHRRKPPRC